MRALFGHLPDRVGGIPVALGSLAAEAAGQVLLWTAPTPAAALAGAVLPGLGCSLIFPAMGIKVVRPIPPHLRGAAAARPAGSRPSRTWPTASRARVTGLLADRFGFPVVFLVGGLAASLGFALVIAIARQGRAEAA